MNSFQSPFVPGLPRFTGGAVGYLGYDTAAWFEPTARARAMPAAPIETMPGSCCSTRCWRSITCSIASC